MVKEWPCGFLREEHSREREELGIGHKVSMCLEFSRNSKDASVAGLERVGGEKQDD